MRRPYNPGDDWLKELMRNPRAKKYAPKLIFFFEIAFYSSLLIGIVLFLYLLVIASG
jgi:hypothetical protein